MAEARACEFNVDVQHRHGVGLILLSPVTCTSSYLDAQVKTDADMQTRITPKDGECSF